MKTKKNEIIKKTSLIILLLSLIITAGCVYIHYPEGRVTSGDRIKVQVATNYEDSHYLSLYIDDDDPDSQIGSCFCFTFLGCYEPTIEQMDCDNAMWLGCDTTGEIIPGHTGCGMELSVSVSDMGITCGGGWYSKTFIGKSLEYVGDELVYLDGTSPVNVCCPGTEICDGIDNNCIGGIDEGTLCTGNDVCYAGSCCTPSCPADYCANTGQPNGCGGTCPNNEGISCGTETLVCIAGENCACEGGLYMCDTDADQLCTKTCSGGVCQSCTSLVCERLAEAASYSNDCDNTENNCGTTGDTIPYNSCNLILDEPCGEETLCNNFDEDCDGIIDDGLTNCDCADGGSQSAEEDCGDGIDNDCNTILDCADTDNCPEETNCGTNQYCIMGVCIPAYYDENDETYTPCTELLCASLTSEEEVDKANEVCGLGCMWDESLGKGIGGGDVVIDPTADCSAKAYWSKDYVGDSMEVNLILKASGSCEGVLGPDISFIICEFGGDCLEPFAPVTFDYIQNNAEVAWIANYTGDCEYPPYECGVDGLQRYFFIATGSTMIQSSTIFVAVCDLEYDADCDGICDADEVPPSGLCELNEIGGVAGDLCDGTQVGVDTGGSGCTQGQSTCVAEWDCTNAPWSDCDEETGKRTREIETAGVPLCTCTPPKNPCCDWNVWKTQIPTVKSCIIEEEFPVFNFQNFVLVILVLVVFYIFLRKQKNKKKVKKRKMRSK